MSPEDEAQELTLNKDFFDNINNNDTFSPIMMFPSTISTGVIPVEELDNSTYNATQRFKDSNDTSDEEFGMFGPDVQIIPIGLVDDDLGMNQTFSNSSRFRNVN